MCHKSPRKTTVDLYSSEYFKSKEHILIESMLGLKYQDQKFKPTWPVFYFCLVFSLSGTV